MTERMAAAERVDAPTTVEGALAMAGQLHAEMKEQLHEIADEKQERIDELFEEIADLREQITYRDEADSATIASLRVQAIEHGRELTAEQIRRRKAEAAVVEVRAALAEYRACQLDGRQTINLIDTITKDT